MALGVGLRKQAVEQVMLNGTAARIAWIDLNYRLEKPVKWDEFLHWLWEFDQFYYPDGKPRAKYGRMAVNKEDFYKRRIHRGEG